jgi:hypothetical protein
MDGLEDDPGAQAALGIDVWRVPGFLDEGALTGTRPRTRAGHRAGAPLAATFFGVPNGPVSLPAIVSITAGLRVAMPAAQPGLSAGIPLP